MVVGTRRVPKLEDLRTRTTATTDAGAESKGLYCTMFTLGEIFEV